MRFLCPTRFELQLFYPTGRGAGKLPNRAFGRVMSKKWPRRPIRCMSLRAMDAKNGRHSNVWMQVQALTPGVQHHPAADLRAQMLRRGADLQQGLAHGPNQQVVVGPWVRQGQRVECVRHGKDHGKDHVKAPDGQEFGLPRFEPRCPLATLARRTMPIIARVLENHLSVVP